mmetsp:Transcript_44003/g.94806  ORF Transcript_44003/g.94806 Transcript_44003/m.94806 type:complete len:455 (+) Transcript_44003:58-1422(+)
MASTTGAGPKRRWTKTSQGAGAGGGTAQTKADLPDVGTESVDAPSSASTAEVSYPAAVSKSDEREPRRKGKGKGKSKGEDTTIPVPAPFPQPATSAKANGRGRGGASIRLAAEPYETGARQAYLKKYQDDLQRFRQRPDFHGDARWVDSHCHFESILQRTWRGGGKPEVIDREPLASLPDLVASWPEGLDGGICNCVFIRPSKPGNPSEWQWLQTNLHHFQADSPIGHKLWFTVGIHPHDVGNWNERTEAMLRRLAENPKCVGIGECGLDFFKHDANEAREQFAVFEAQAKIAVELKKALVVHGRLVTKENEEKCLALLQKHLPKDHPIHIHCYSDSLELARALIEHFPNLRIGFTGSITFKDKPGNKGKSKGKGGLTEKKGEEHNWELVFHLPLERLLIETDGPYMCPEPFRGQTAHPGHVHRVAEKIAEWQGVSITEVLRATRESTRVVYGV